MKLHRVVLALVMIVSVTTLARAERIHASLIGYNEVPSVSTPATGDFKARISKDDSMIEYTLSFENLVGTVQQSHIHFAQRGVNGSIVVWLCQTATTPAPPSVAASTPMCPSPGGTVTGVITKASVITAATASQQIVAGELDEVIAAIRAGFAYVNVHATPLNPGGEIRGQIKAADDDKDKR